MSALTFLGSPDPNDRFELFEQIELGEYLVGTGDHCGLQLRDPMVAREHARFLQRDGDWYVGRAALLAPTLLNGVPVDLGKAMRLDPGDVITVGDTWLRFGRGRPRRPVPTDGEQALIAADQLAEEGEALGQRMLEGETELDSWLDESLRQGVKHRNFEITLRFGLFARLRVRLLSHAPPLFMRGELTRLLSSPLASGLTYLEVELSTWDAPDQLSHALMTAIGASAPPALKSVDLGVIARLDEALLHREWSRLTQELPWLRGTEPRVRFGVPTVIVEEPGELPLEPGPLRAAVVVPLPALANRPEAELQRIAEFHGGLPAAFRLTREEVVRVGGLESFTHNGHRTSGAFVLCVGDVVEFRGARFRVERGPLAV